MNPRNKEDRLTGVLSLSADKNGQLREGCIGEEELALLIESKLPQDRKQQCMDHLAHCDSCYRQWVSLKDLLEPQGSHKIIPLPGRKNYKYIGSSLAVAATVAVFLNIQEPKVTEPPESPGSPAVLQQSIMEESVMDSGQGLSVQEEPVEDKMASPAPLPKSRKLESVEKTKRSEDSVLEMGVNLEKESKNQQLESTQPTARARLQKKVGASSLSFVSLVEEGCRQDGFDALFWQKVKSKKLNWVSLQERKGVEELIATMDEGNWKSHCDQILSLLAKEGESR